jgi:hypothetical protein
MTLSDLIDIECDMRGMMHRARLAAHLSDNSEERKEYVLRIWGLRRNIKHIQRLMDRKVRARIATMKSVEKGTL